MNFLGPLRQLRRSMNLGLSAEFQAPGCFHQWDVWRAKRGFQSAGAVQRAGKPACAE